MKVSNYYLNLISEGTPYNKANKLTCDKFGLKDAVDIAKVMIKEREDASKTIVGTDFGIHDQSTHTRGPRVGEKIAAHVNVKLDIPLTSEEAVTLQYVAGPMFKEMEFTEMLFEVARCIHVEKWSRFLAVAVIIQKLQTEVLKGKH